MAEQEPQNFANHARTPRPTVVATLFTILALACFALVVIREPSILSLGLLCLTAAVMTLVLISRFYIVRLQDRIIRLEMQLRLERLGLATMFRQLSTRQIVALRFASDAELPALAQRALAENLSNRQIKEAVRDWQADHHRT